MMEQSSAIVTDGMTMGGDLSQALDRIAQVVADVYKLAEEIGSATNEQANGSAQISTATSRLNEITNEISAAADEQSNGAGGVVKAMEKMRELVQAQASGSAELAASAEQMSRMAAHMVDSVGRFTIDTQNADNPTHPTMSHSRLKAASASAGGR
jgi:methyl-accepting chemotaxis protein